MMPKRSSSGPSSSPIVPVEQDSWRGRGRYGVRRRADVELPIPRHHLVGQRPDLRYRQHRYPVVENVSFVPRIHDP